MNETDLKEPVFFENSLEEAEKACFSCLCDTLQYSGGRDAFIESNQGMSDCMVFDIGHMTHPETACFPSQTYCFEATATFYNRSRRDLQKIAMKLLREFPSGGHFPQREALKDSNVAMLRLSGSINPFSDIEISEFEVNGKKIVTRMLTATFDVVFATGARSSVE